MNRCTAFGAAAERELRRRRRAGDEERSWSRERALLRGEQKRPLGYRFR